MNRYLAELVATFTLCFVGAGSIILDAHTNGALGLVGIALAHGLALSVAISAIAATSGGHVNPAVTIGFLVTGKISPKDAGGYILFQLLGASIAGFALRAMYPAAGIAATHLGTPALGPGVGVGQGIVIEALMTFFLVFAVWGTAVDPRAPKIGGFGIGLTVAFDILCGGPLTGAAMNPARAFGPALAAGFWDAHVVYWIGPILGGIAAALLYQALFLPAEER